MLRSDLTSEAMDEKGKKILSRIQAMCARREYCIGDIRRKALERLDGDSAAAEEIVSMLVEDRFVDELRYASAFASEKSALGGWGQLKIRRALSAKGIPSETIDTALSEIDKDKAVSRLVRLMENKWKTLQDDPQGRLKLLRYALSRGYGYDEVRPVAERLTSGQGGDGI